MWKEVLDEGTPRLDSDLKIYCEFHPDTEMEVVLVKPQMFPLKKNNEEYTAYALDLHMRCPKCGMRSMMGVAITKELFYEVLPD